VSTAATLVCVSSLDDHFDYTSNLTVDLRLQFDGTSRLSQDQVYMVLAMAVHRSPLSIDQILAFY